MSFLMYRASAKSLGNHPSRKIPASRSFATASISATNPLLAKLRISGEEGRYALALFNVAKQQGQVDDVLSQAKEAVRNYQEAPTARALFALKGIDPSSIENGLSLLVSKPTDVTSSFFKQVAANKMAPKIDQIMKNYVKLARHHRNEVEATVTVARTAGPHELEMIENTLNRAWADSLEGHRIILTQQVDESLVGGWKAQIGWRQYDASAKTQLNHRTKQIHQMVQRHFDRFRQMDPNDPELLLDTPTAQKGPAVNRLVREILQAKEAKKVQQGKSH